MNLALGDGSRPGRALSWFGHYSFCLELTIFPLIIADIIAGYPSLLEWPATILVLLWCASINADLSWHMMRICERCIAASPLNPQAAVERWRPALRAYHIKAARVLLNLAIMGWFVFGGRYRQPPPWVTLLSVLAFLLFGLSGLMVYKHRQLYPWCPWCNWRGGGFHEPSPDIPIVPAART